MHYYKKSCREKENYTASRRIVLAISAEYEPCFLNHCSFLFGFKTIPKLIKKGYYKKQVTYV
jgi:hypothetical protein